MRKIRYIAILIISMLLWNPIVADASSNIAIDTNSAQEGVVRISYQGLNKKTKVMVEKGSTKYYYDLKNEEDYFPLQLGDGSYTVAVLENTSGTKYKVLTKKSFDADIDEENSLYLQSTQPIIWDEDMEAIQLAGSLAHSAKDSEEAVKIIYDYIIKNIDYDYQKIDKLSSDYTPDIDTVLNDGKGICYDYAVLFGAMLRSQGIPTKLVKGYRDGIDAYHAWNEVYLDGSWKVIDTTYDAYLFKSGTSYQMFQDKDDYEKLKEY